jgi:hypothetical protein
MPFIPKTPASCLGLDLGHVSRVLAKHLGDITRAAKELGVTSPELRRLTWAKPKLLEAAHEEMFEIAARAHGEVIEAMFSDSDRRREWAADIILSSYMGRNDPMAPARRWRASSPQVTVRLEVRAAGRSNDPSIVCERKPQS